MAIKIFSGIRASSFLCHCERATKWGAWQSPRKIKFKVGSCLETATGVSRPRSDIVLQTKRLSYARTAHYLQVNKPNVLSRREETFLHPAGWTWPWSLAPL